MTKIICIIPSRAFIVEIREERIRSKHFNAFDFSLVCDFQVIQIISHFNSNIRTRSWHNLQGTITRKAIMKVTLVKQFKSKLSVLFAKGGQKVCLLKIVNMQFVNYKASVFLVCHITFILVMVCKSMII